jgi:hypothetical protein
VAASVQQIQVSSQPELESTIVSYIAQGFVVSNRTPDSVTLFKKKEFNVIWAVVGFFLCLLPLLVYCIVYTTQSDEMVVVTIAAVQSAGQLTWSEDRQWWWDGERWRDALLELPPQAVISEDRGTWWDGESWRPVPTPVSIAEDAGGAGESGGASVEEGSAPTPPAADPGGG